MENRFQIFARGLANNAKSPSSILNNAFISNRFEKSKLERIADLNSHLEKTKSIEEFVSNYVSGDGMTWLNRTFIKFLYKDSNIDTSVTGTKAHTQIHEWIKNRSLFKHTTEELSSDATSDHLKSFLQWFYDSNMKNIENCGNINSSKYGIKGRCDAVGIDTSNKTCLLEFKTGPLCPTHLLQIAAYTKAYRHHHKLDVNRAVIVCLNGQYTVKTLEEDELNVAYKAYRGFRRLHDYNSELAKVLYSTKL